MLNKRETEHKVTRLIEIIDQVNKFINPEYKLHLRHKDYLVYELLYIQSPFVVEISINNPKFGEWVYNFRFEELDHLNFCIQNPFYFCKKIIESFQNSALPKLITNKKHLGRIYAKKPSKPYLKNLALNFLGFRQIDLEMES
jgi:hypothetical protein